MNAHTYMHVLMIIGGVALGLLVAFEVTTSVFNKLGTHYKAARWYFLGGFCLTWTALVGMNYWLDSFVVFMVNGAAFGLTWPLRQLLRIMVSERKIGAWRDYKPTKYMVLVIPIVAMHTLLWPTLMPLAYLINRLAVEGKAKSR